MAEAQKIPVPKKPAPQGRPAPRKKIKRGMSARFKVISVIVILALMGASFFAGWQFGVKSTKFQGEILLVNESHPLAANYVPDDLVNLYEQRHSFRLNATDIYLTRETYAAAEEMFAAAEAENMNGFIITSGYRDYNAQAQVYAESEPGKAARPGASEHQTGMAFDIAVADSPSGLESTPQFQWLLKNCHKYGFIQRFPANKSEETGISYEPWHFRYVGKAAAKEIAASGLSLEAFIERNK